MGKNTSTDADDAVTIEIGPKTIGAVVFLLVVSVGLFMLWPQLQGLRPTMGEPGPGEVLASVGERKITARDVEVMYQIQKSLAGVAGRALNEDPDIIRSVRRDMLDSLVDNSLLVDAARADGITATPAEVDTDLVARFQAQGVNVAAAKPTALAAGLTDEEWRAWGVEQLIVGRYIATEGAQAKGHETLRKRGLPEQMVVNTPVGVADVASSLQETADIKFFLMGQSGGAAPVREGQPAPDFVVNGMDGKPVTLSSFRGKPVMVNFWATWCGPCKVEMPIYSQTYNDHKDEGLQILAVNVQEKLPLVQQYLTTSPLPFPVVLDEDGAVATVYRVRGLPTTVFIGADGNVTKVHRGAITKPEDLTPLLQEILPTTEAYAAPALGRLAY